MDFVNRYVPEVAGEGDVQLDLDVLPPERQKEFAALLQAVLAARATVLETFCSPLTKDSRRVSSNLTSFHHEA
jgi:hypothetical protein